MKPDCSPEETQSVQQIIADLLDGHIDRGMKMLRVLKDEIHAAIPARQRQSRGITWVLQRISQLFISECTTQPQDIRTLADILFKNLELNDFLVGVPIFLMAEYGKSNPPPEHLLPMSPVYTSGTRDESCFGQLFTATISADFPAALPAPA
jgi:hypothetical protein